MYIIAVIETCIHGCKVKRIVFEKVSNIENCNEKTNKADIRLKKVAPYISP